MFWGDIRDAYHVAPFAGCTGELVWGRGVVGIEDIPGDESGSESSEDEREDSNHDQHGSEKTFELPEDPLSQISLSSGDGVSANDLCGVGAFTWDAAQKRAGERVTSQRMALNPTDVS